jgi:phi LC3 family holin
MEQKINWKIRFRNKTWLAGFISQTLLLIQAIIFGLEGLHVIDIDMEQARGWEVFVTGIVDLFLAYMAYLGIVIDPTVEGVGDSARALTRDEPLPDTEKNKLYVNK